MPNVISLIDINNFYASCERVFRPDLTHTPLIVLSSNDGCVIARSQEAKNLGIPMGIPFFKIKGLIETYNIKVFSSNFALYGDMSRRFASLISSFSEEMEMYSIDEIFLHPPVNTQDFFSFGQEVKKTVSQCLGLPISLGFSHTKTLAKVANHWAKKDPSYKGVCVLLTKEAIAKALENLPIENVWGIGRRLSPKLRSLGLNCAQDLAMVDPKWIRKIHSVTLEQTVRELQGTPCFSLETSPSAPKSIQVSRSFGTPLTQIHEIEGALSSFLEKGALNLRKKDLFTFGIYIYLGIRNKEAGKLSFTSTFLPFPHGVQDVRVMIQEALRALPSLFKKGLIYKKAGILLTEVGPRHKQLSFLNTQKSSCPKDKALFATVDTICKKHGLDAVFLASSLSSKWQPKRNNMSPSYTTKWSDLPIVFGH